MSPTMIFFILIGAVSLAGAVGVVASRQPVHSALFLLTNFVTLAVMYIMLDAQFLAAAQVIIYAGGIVILILFVIMLIGGDRIGGGSARIWFPYAGILLGVLLISLMVYSYATAAFGAPPTGAIVQGGVPEVLGITLFTRYILPFEMVAILLLVALIGALLLARRPKIEDKA
ncbi:MAG: NADH-quinone oxidoreductase subunit J [Litorilinea sp.]